MIQGLEPSIIKRPFVKCIEKLDYYHPHWHDNTFEFVLVLKGSINATLGAEHFVMKEEDVLIVSLEDVHHLSKTEEDNIVLIFQINYEYFEKQFPNMYRWILICDPKERKARESEFEYLRYYLAKVILNLNEASGQKETMKEILPLLNYCEKVFQSTHMLKKKFDITDKQLDMFYEIEDYVYDNYTKSIDLNSISEYMNFNRYYFSHLVKKITGMNFLEYLNHIRVLAAERLLISTDLNVSQIAFKCGFSEIRSLTRYFKKWHQCTPTQYRKIYCSPYIKKDKDVTLIDIDNFWVRAKISKYLSKIEKIKEIDLSAEERSMPWEMPKIIIPEIVEACDRSRYKALLENVIEECSIKSVVLPSELSLDILLNEQYEWVDFFAPKVGIVLKIASCNAEEAENYSEIIKTFVRNNIQKYGEQVVSTWEVQTADTVLQWNIQHKLGYLVKTKVYTEQEIETHLNFDDYSITPYLLKNVMENRYENIKMMDGSLYKIPAFNNDKGLITNTGIKKSVYYAYFFLSHISNIIIKEDGFVVSKGNKGIQILLYNSLLNEGDENDKFQSYKDLVFEILLKNVNTDYKVKRYYLDEESGNAYLYWKKLGKPFEIDHNDEQLIKKASFPKINFDEIKNHKYIKLYEKIPPGGAQLIVLEEK